MQMRIETDSLGERRIPASAYYGVQTDRAIENFRISGIMPAPAYIEATVRIKKAAAQVNRTLGLLDARKAEAIVQSCEEILSGKLREWFLVDVYQAGAGTSHNMNANEVIANRSIELLGGSKGDYSIVHPNDHVNMSQSTNDVCPTAIRIAALTMVASLDSSIKALQDSLAGRAAAFDPVIKSGRTHLQDAVPLTLGQEFGGYATAVLRHRENIRRAAEESKELGIGGTAAGTGLNAHPDYRALMVQELSRDLRIEFRMAENYFEAMQSMRPFVSLSGALRNLAQDLIRVSNDLRLLSSGPHTGLAEIVLPHLQPGSSIMPGKVNPVMAEMLAMVCFQVVGSDMTILLASQAGQLELNVMMPVIAYNLLHSITILGNAIDAFEKSCVRGITANAGRCREYAEASMSLVTAIAPIIGYQKAAEVAHENLATGKPIREIVIERGWMTREKLEEVLDLHRMTTPGVSGT